MGGDVKQYAITVAAGITVALIVKHMNKRGQQ